MPLFESIEGDVTAFFVSQGSVFDALTRSLMERTARVESRVDALATDVASNFQRVNQLIHSVSVTVDAHAAATVEALARQLEQAQSQHQAAIESVNISISNNSTNSTSNSTNNTLEASPAVNGHMDTHELEYYIMTLSRQLHVVLELFFQPYVSHDAAHGIQAKQAQFETISDVLTQNEAILMQLSAVDAAHISTRENGDQQQEQQQEQAVQEPKDALGTHAAQDLSAINSILETHENEGGNGDESENEQQEQEIAAPGAPTEAATSSQQEQIDDEPSDDNNQASISANQVEAELPAEEMEEPLRAAVQPSTEVAPDDMNPSEFSSTIIPDERPSEAQIREARVREQTDREGRRRIGTPTTDGSYNSRKRKKSLYDSFRDFHAQQLTQDERQRLKEQELLHKVQQLLQAARKQWQQEVTASMAFTWQRKLQELENQQLKLQREWQYHQQQQTPSDLVHLQQQQEFDRQLATFSATFLSSQQTQEQQIARILDSLRDFQDQFVQKMDFDSMASAWLQTARDECVFGVNADALAAFKQELEDFQTQLGNQELSPLIERLLGEVNSVLELLNKVLGLLGSEDGGGGLHGSEGFQLMQTLRTFLTMLDDLAQSLESDKESSAKSAAFISETLRQMELGTANLLEAFEAQQDRYQQAFEQQQLAIAQLQRELWDQKQADQELKSQLAGCPSQEDTMRFIQELRDQVRAN